VLDNGGLRALEPRSIALVACYDGTSPFDKWTQYSVTIGQWLIANLPPHVRGRSDMIICTGIQTGPGKSKNHRTYMRHEVNKLLVLNKGIPAFDAATDQKFTLHARVIATLGDYPGKTLYVQSIICTHYVHYMCTLNAHHHYVHIMCTICAHLMHTTIIFVVQ